jgi:murein L,D-transpeptidase YcbB/YkuD
MVCKLRLAVLVLAGLGVAELDSGAIGPAEAQGFFDGGAFYPPRYERRPVQRYRSPYGSSFWWNAPPRQQAPQVQAYVSSPKYYTYKPDELEDVSFAALLAPPEVPGEDDGEAASDGGAGEARPAHDAAEVAVDEAFAAARGSLGSYRLRALPEVGEALVEHYREHPAFLWVENGHVNGQAYGAITALQRAERFGLASEDYAVELPAGSAARAGEAQHAPSPIEFEMALSAKMLTYVLDANRGRIDPNRLSGYHDFKRKAVDLAATLGDIAISGDIGRYLDGQSPGNAAFTALVAELDELRQVESPKSVKIADGTLLRPGGESPELTNIVAAIRLSGSPELLGEHEATLAAYGGGTAYGEALVALVRDFQREKGLHVDGIVGQNTIRAMVPETVADKVHKIELALERLRWLPRELGRRHVFINQPAFLASYMEEGKEPLTMRIVVGQKSNQTYFFADRVEKVEYNPYWGVPYSIIVNEMLPQLYADPSYLDRAGYEVTTTSGARVSSSQIDWGAVATKQTSVNVRQPPGGGNALGRVKILFPNRHAIYMHDTPHKDLFERDSRAFSHGCVRLQRPREMAAAVLGKSVEYVDSRIAEGQNDSDEITDNIPVYVSYFTAWPEADGTVRFYDDMYERDMYLTRAIEATASARHAES